MRGREGEAEAEEREREVINTMNLVSFPSSPTLCI